MIVHISMVLLLLGFICVWQILHIYQELCEYNWQIGFFSSYKWSFIFRVSMAASSCWPLTPLFLHILDHCFKSPFLIFNTLCTYQSATIPRPPAFCCCPVMPSPCCGSTIEVAPSNYCLGDLDPLQMGSMQH